MDTSAGAVSIARRSVGAFDVRSVLTAESASANSRAEAKRSAAFFFRQRSMMARRRSPRSPSGSLRTSRMART